MSRAHAERPQPSVLIADDNRDAADTLALCLQLDGHRVIVAYDGLSAIDRNEDFVAGTREMIGPKVELMLDCWMAFEVEFAVRLAERLRPYRLKWMEDCLIPENGPDHDALRRNEDAE